MKITHPLDAWHHIVVTQDPTGLQDLLAADVVFHSPVVHTPQRGKEVVTRYPEAALHVFFSPTFRIVRKLYGDTKRKEAITYLRTVSDFDYQTYLPRI